MEKILNRLPQLQVPVGADGVSHLADLGRLAVPPQAGRTGPQGKGKVPTAGTSKLCVRDWLARFLDYVDHRISVATRSCHCNL